ncbi:MAG: exosortase K [Flavobacteriales bacterium]|nr:exosortase K [Flavobacteriales bacterium]
MYRTPSQRIIAGLIPNAWPLVLLCAALLLKWWSTSASLEDLTFLLGPIARIVSAFSGETWSIAEGNGYLFPALGIVIDRSCSGIHFLVVSWATFAGLFLLRKDKSRIRSRTVLLMAAAGYALTVVVNSGRILSIVRVQQMGITLGPTQHEAFGGLLYVIVLCLACLLLDRHLRHSPPPHALLA